MQIYDSERSKVPVPTVTNTWRVVLHSHMSTLLFENVIHVGAPIASSHQDVADDVGAAWVAASSWVHVEAIDLVHDTIEVQPYDGVSAPTEHDVDGFTGVAGGTSGEAVPPQVACVVTLRTGLAGRSHRGRLYVVGVNRVYLNATDTRWDLAFGDTTLQEAADTFRQELASSGTVTGWSLYSPTLDSADDITECVARAYLGTQRRRAHASF